MAYKMVDMMVGALHDPFHTIHMGVTAENVAAEHGISREAQDALARKATGAEKAWAEGRFKDQIVQVMLKSRKGEVAFEKDEHFRTGATLEDFQEDEAGVPEEDGTVTAANASGINDAAAAVVLMEAGAAKARGASAEPAWWVTRTRRQGPDRWALARCRPRTLLKKLGMKIDQMDVIEANEAFAAQACAVTRVWEPTRRVRPTAPGISLGHLARATGALITVKALYDCSASRASTRWSPCASAAARASRRSSAHVKPARKPTKREPAGSLFARQILNQDLGAFMGQVFTPIRL